MKRYLPTVILSIVSTFYFVFGIVGGAFKALDGHSWDGDTDTLTSVLAVLAVLFQVLSQTFAEQCKKAPLRRLGDTPMEPPQVDAAIHGPSLWPPKWDPPYRRSIYYRVILPVIALLTIAILVKAFNTGLVNSSVLVSGKLATFVDPIDTRSGLRGVGFPGAITYNTTASLVDGLDPNKVSWTYMVANSSDPTGLQTIQYLMPSLPILVIGGSTGYDWYSAESMPTLVSVVQCSNTTQKIPTPSGEVKNDSNDIQLVDQKDGSAYIQVTTTADAAWSCVAHMGTTTGRADFMSDRHGVWNTTAFRMQNPSNVSFSTTPAGWNMMADIIYEALDATAGVYGWDWNTSTKDSKGYSQMLQATRLSFSIATLAFTENRAKPGPSNVTGQGSHSVEKVILQSNWALGLTVALLMLQGLMASIHAVRSYQVFKALKVEESRG